MIISKSNVQQLVETLNKDFNQFEGKPVVELKDYLDPPDVPQWVIGPLQYQTEQKLEQSPGFDAQVKLTKWFYDQTCSKTIIDFGCWLGVLALKTHWAINPEKMILVDAVPIYLRMARELFKKHNIEKNVYAKEMCIVPNPSSYPGYFKISLSDSINTSNILDQPRQLSNKLILEMPTCKAYDPKQGAEALAALIDSNTFLKLDLDSVDGAVITNLLELGIRPKAMTWENLLDNSYRKEQCKQLVKLLREHGYNLPDRIDLDIERYTMIDIFVSEEDWALMCYEHPKGKKGAYWVGAYSSRAGMFVR